MTLTDTHCHLDFNAFDPDREAVVERAVQVGVGRILIPGINLDSSSSAVELAGSHPILFAAIGIHPTEAAGYVYTMLNDFRKWSRHPKVKAIGEVGLDYHHGSAPHRKQQEVLKEQLALAAELRLPVILHFREKGDAPTGDCIADLLEILDQWVTGLKQDQNPLAERPGVLHSFSGNLEAAWKAISLGFYLGVGGPITYKNNTLRQELVAAIPLERLLIETDAPFQTPQPHRGKRNEPAYVRVIADKIASVHICTPGLAAEMTSRNAAQLLSWD